MNEQKINAPIPSATIILGRDRGDAIEMFMVKRNRRIDFAAGALVFPGGRVDVDDTAPGVIRRCGGAMNQCREPDPGFYVAAIREVYEESGILLVREGGAATIISPERLAGFEDKRRALCAGELKFSELLENEDLYPACDRLTPFAHWITPEFMPKRFDTWFFVADAPDGQVGSHDGSESVDSLWITPADVLTGASGGRFMVIFPTRMNIAKMARFCCLDEARSYCLEHPAIPVLPRMEQRAGGPVLCIPAEADYGLTEESVANLGF
ncbi:MAG: NUDIX hydrolase [Thermodesulfobacteriota bacterium]